MKKLIKGLSILILSVLFISLFACKKKSSVVIYNNLFSDNLACVNIDGKWGYVDSNENTVIAFDYDDATPFKDGYAILKQSGLYFAINTKGEAITHGYTDLKYLSDGYFAFELLDKYGVINAKEKTIIENKYDDIFAYSNKVYICKKDDKYGLVNKNGKELTDFIYSSIYAFSEGFALASRDDKYGFINNSGKEIIPFDYEEASSFNGKYAYVKVRDEKYLINNRNKIGFTISNGYSVNTYDDKYIVVSNDETGKYSLYNYKNEAIISDVDNIIVKNGSDISYIASILYEDSNLKQINIYNYKNMKRIFNSSEVTNGYNLNEYYFDYVTCFLYIRYLNSDGSTSLMYGFNGKEVSMTNIVTSYYIKNITNSVITTVDNNGYPLVINGMVGISNGYDISIVSFVTNDGYVVYKDTNGKFGAFDKTGEKILTNKYRYIRSLYSIDA